MDLPDCEGMSVGSVTDLTLMAQWSALRAWLGTLPADLSAPSALDGWTVEDLVAHLVAVTASVGTLQQASADTEPCSIAEYLGGYAGRAQRVAEAAREIAGTADLLARMDSARDAAIGTLTRFGGRDPVVIAPGGAILLSDFLQTRLIELVVHAGDLQRSVPDHPAPRVLPAARSDVLTTLRAVLAERAEQPVAAIAAASTLPAVEFIDYAAGRVALPPELKEQLGDVLPLF